MPDIGLLQGAPPKRRVVHTPVLAAAAPMAAAEPEPVAAPLEYALPSAYSAPVAPPAQRVEERVGELAEQFAAAPGRQISVQVVSSEAVVETPAVAAAPIATPAAMTAPAETTASAEPPPAPGGPSIPSSASLPAAASRALEPIATRDLLWLALALLVIIGTGLGIRDPWPADEPRFAAIARDMVATGEWLFPRVGGDLYQDKPPVFFWMLAVGYAVFGSIRWSFLIPSFLAAGGVLFLVYDFGRRLVGRQAGLAAALLTVCTLHFVMVMRGAQIDPVLCFFVTFALYGLLRHLLLGPAWGWYFAGGFVAGIGIITKGVGFLPLLVLIPFFLMRAFRWQGLAPLDGGALGARWWLAPLGMLLATLMWFIPMVVAVKMSGAPEYAAYRDEILFKQTVSRYAASWHHVKPWYYFILEVIPALWLPFSLLLFWLVPKFRAAWRERDARIWLPLAWSLLVLLFFSMSPGKRGVYIHPALPGLALASLPLLPGLMARPGVRRAGWVLALIFWGVALLALLGASFNLLRLPAEAAELPVMRLLLTYVMLGAASLLWARKFAPLAAWPAALGALCIAFSYTLAPAMNSERSSSGFVRSMLAQVQPDEELALVAYKEQFLLYLDRPTVNFGHRRWLEGPQESYDASAWLDAGPHRVLLVPASGMKPCFPTHATIAGRSSDEDWFLVRGPASSACASKGDASKAIHYDVKPR